MNINDRLAAPRCGGGKDWPVTTYHDGTQFGQTTLFDVLGDVSGKPWVIGQDWDSSTAMTDFYRGAMNDVRIYDRALSASDIQALASGGTLIGGSIQGNALTLSTVVTRLAGSGLGATTDVTGTGAEFDIAARVTTDGTSLFVTDFNGHRIRKIVISTRIATTLAGGNGWRGLRAN